MRTQVSMADDELLSYLEEVGVPASRFQLERWRSRGMLPRAVVERDGWGGSAVRTHPSWVFEAAERLAQVSTRGRPWEVTALSLFAEGLPISEQCLRAAAKRLAAKLSSHWVRRWEEASAELSPHPRTAAEELEDLAHEALRLGRRHPSTRVSFTAVVEELQLSMPISSDEELKLATARALQWRVVQMVGVRPLTREELRIARFGSEHLPTPNFVVPLPADRDACIATLTLREAYLHRRHILLLEHMGAVVLDPNRSLLDLVAWAVAGGRLNSDNADPSQPLDAKELDRLEEDLRFGELALSDQVDGQLSLWPLNEASPTTDVPV